MSTDKRDHPLAQMLPFALTLASDYTPLISASQKKKEKKNPPARTSHPKPSPHGDGSAAVRRVPYRERGDRSRATITASAYRSPSGEGARHRFSPPLPENARRLRGLRTQRHRRARSLSGGSPQSLSTTPPPFASPAQTLPISTSASCHTS